MKFRARHALPGFALFCFLFACAGFAASAKDFKFEAILVWASNADKSPDPRHKPVDPDVRKKLEELPLKWKNYFEVHREAFTVASRGSQKVTLSEDCDVHVRDVDGKNFEISLIGKRKPVLKRSQPIARGEVLVVGGNAPDSTGWLVVLKRTE